MVLAVSIRTPDCYEPLGGNYKMQKLILAPTGSGFNKVMTLGAVSYFRVVFVQKA